MRAGGEIGENFLLAKISSYTVTYKPTIIYESIFPGAFLSKLFFSFMLKNWEALTFCEYGQTTMYIHIL